MRDNGVDVVDDVSPFSRPGDVRSLPRKGEVYDSPGDDDYGWSRYPCGEIDDEGASPFNSQVAYDRFLVMVSCQRWRRLESIGPDNRMRRFQAFQRRTFLSTSQTNSTIFHVHANLVTTAPVSLLRTGLATQVV
jgi:hypothetical protein